MAPLTKVERWASVFNDELPLADGILAPVEHWHERPITQLLALIIILPRWQQRASGSARWHQEDLQVATTTVMQWDLRLYVFQELDLIVATFAAIDCDSECGSLTCDRTASRQRGQTTAIILAAFHTNVVNKMCKFASFADFIICQEVTVFSQQGWYVWNVGWYYRHSETLHHEGDL